MLPPDASPACTTLAMNRPPDHPAAPPKAQPKATPKGNATSDTACPAETTVPAATLPQPQTRQPPPPDPWAALRQHTNARIALGRVGTSLPTAEVLRFGAAHAMARDAIHTPLDSAALAASLQADGWHTLDAHSQAPTRADYLLRPDLGRRLSAASLHALQALHLPAFDLLLVLGDGLSPVGIQRHALPLLHALRTQLSHLPSPRQPDGPLRLGPVVVARQARVALGDDIAQALHAPMVAVLIGERPGLSSPDSVGIYLTRHPQVGCHDAQRNCISNVRPEGQDFATAARRFAWLVRQAHRLGTTGIHLKDESDLETLEQAAGHAPMIC